VLVRLAVLSSTFPYTLDPPREFASTNVTVLITP
jgi:hypothetical protein